MNKFNILALLEEIPCDYDSDTDVDENFDKNLDIIYKTDLLSCSKGDEEIEVNHLQNVCKARLNHNFIHSYAVAHRCLF